MAGRDVNRQSIHSHRVNMYIASKLLRCCPWGARFHEVSFKICFFQTQASGQIVFRFEISGVPIVPDVQFYVDTFSL